MSGLGDTVQPMGEPGNVTRPVPVQPETLPDNPGTIVQSTAIQTLDQLLKGNWIYDSTFTVSTSMPAGTILFTKPIHPGVWNWPNRQVSSMFNVWTGSGKVRYRPLATAWYGGSIRVGFLPPNIQLDGVRQMPLELLTTYPNRDIDPKNTGWVDFRGPDQREVAYHYMAAFDSKDRTNFGGWIVFYVAGKLVTQSPEFSTIQFVVETAGDFEYDQPNPQALSPHQVGSDPLKELDDLPLGLQPLCDSRQSGSSTILVVVENTITTLPYPGGECAAFGAPWKQIGQKVPGVDMSNAVRNMMNTRNKANSTIFWFFKGTMLDTEFVPWHGSTVLREDSANQWTNSLTNIQAGENTKVVTWTIGKCFSSTNVLLKVQGNDLTLKEGDVTAPNMYTMNPNNSNNFIVSNNSSTSIYLRVAAMPSGESFVVFGNFTAQTYAAQTAPMARLLAKFNGTVDEPESCLYNVVNKNGTPLMLVRLCSNGIFTTNATKSQIVLPAEELYLRYIGNLPVSSPLPQLSATTREVRRIGFKLNSNISDDDIMNIGRELATF